MIWDGMDRKLFCCFLENVLKYANYRVGHKVSLVCVCHLYSVAKFIFSYAVGCKKKCYVSVVQDVEKNKMLIFE